LDFGDLSVYDLYPSPLPDLFSGSQIVVVGRYRGGGSETVTLSGIVNQVTQTFAFEEQNFTRDSRFRSGDTLATLPRLWATRKIGHLLNAVRLNGPDQESIDQIVQLSIRYGIVTPYTSYLVTEPLPLGFAEQERIAAKAMDDAEGDAFAPSFGQAAVEEAADQGKMAGADAPVEIVGEAAEMIRNVGSRTFVYANGIWIDTAFDPENMETVEVAFLSDDYFELVEAVPELAAAFSLGNQVIALSDGAAYQVVSSDEQVDAIEIPDSEPPFEVGEDARTETDPSNSPLGLECAFIPMALILLPMMMVLWRRRF
jgi:Ca-activated chloride channel family protein